MKLLIAIPCMDFVPADFMQSLVGLTRRLTAEDVCYDVAIEAGTLIYMARDKLASKAIKDKFTHVLWLDSDMVFGDGIVEDLQFCGKEFVTGIAHSRRKPFSSCLFKSLDLNTLERWKFEDYPKEAFRVAGCGMACVLMKTEILERVFLQCNTCFMPLLSYGEDLSFCKRAVSVGYEIWAEPCVRIGHMAHIPIWPDEAARWANEQ